MVIPWEKPEAGDTSRLVASPIPGQAQPAQGPGCWGSPSTKNWAHSPCTDDSKNDLLGILRLLAKDF